jgi:hypothetical protein
MEKMRRVKIVLVNGRVIDAACYFSKMEIKNGTLARQEYQTDQGKFLLHPAQIRSAAEYYTPD